MRWGGRSEWDLGVLGMRELSFRKVESRLLGSSVVMISGGTRTCEFVMLCASPVLFQALDRT